MKDSYEQRIQNQLGAFCVRVLKNEARHIQRDYASLLDQEKPLDELTASELEQTAVWDDYFMDEHVFEVLGLPVVVTGNEVDASLTLDLPVERGDGYSRTAVFSVFYCFTGIRVAAETVFRCKDFHYIDFLF